MKKAFTAAHEQPIGRFSFESNHLFHEGGNLFSIELPVVHEPIPFDQLVEALLPQFRSRSLAERFVDQMSTELRRQQLADAIAEMIRI